MRINNFAGILLAVVLVPCMAEGQVANFVFATDPQVVTPGAVSEQITVQARGSGGESVNIPQTGCLSLSSASSQGQFSSNATNWNPVSILTMNKNTANRSFYYKDSMEGIHALTVKVALKPESESRSCANWPIEEWNIQWTATQSITVGVGSQGGNSGGSSLSPTPQSAGIPLSYVAPPEHTIFADAGEDRIVIAGADVEFKGRAYNKKKEPLTGLIRYSWNFGDGGSSEGQAVLHRFVYPGRYAVTLQIAQETESASDTFIVEAKSAQLRLIALSDGALSIENLSGRDLDLSRWILSASGKTFVFSQGTTILKDATVTISAETTGLKGVTGEIALLFPNGTLAFRASEGSVESIPTTNPPATPAAMPAAETSGSRSSVVRARTAPVSISNIADTEEVAAADADDEPAEHVSTSSQVAAVGSPAAGSWGWWLGAFAIAVAGAGSVYFVRRYAKKEWNIVEE